MHISVFLYIYIYVSTYCYIYISTGFLSLGGPGLESLVPLRVAPLTTATSLAKLLVSGCRVPHGPRRRVLLVGCRVWFLNFGIRDACTFGLRDFILQRLGT